MKYTINPHRRRHWAKVAGLRYRAARAIHTPRLPSTQFDRPSPEPGYKYCHAQNCEVAIPVGKFMCRHHWHMLPEELRTRILKSWGLCTRGDLSASSEYLDAVIAAVRHVHTASAAPHQRIEQPLSTL